MSETRKPVIGISCGDLNGIGMEIIMKTFSHGDMMDLCTPVVFASSKVASYHRKALGMDHFNFHIVNDFDKISDRKANLYNCWNDEVNLEFGKVSKDVGQYALKSLQCAIKAHKEGNIDALVTAPIHKNSIQSDQFKFTGHTDFLESEYGGKSTMLMLSEEMRMALATVHIPVSKVSGAVSKELIIGKLDELNRTLNYDFHKKKGKIAVLALNPHAGDSGVMGDEDDKIVTPAIEAAFDKGVMAFGPFPADSFFGSNKHKDFDAILAMYHDQGLIPFKSLSFGQGVNYTAGLDLVRTSPDHGTGFDIAGQNLASESSFREAIYAACDILKNREISKEISKNPLPVKKGKKDY